MRQAQVQVRISARHSMRRSCEAAVVDLNDCDRIPMVFSEYGYKQGFVIRTRIHGIEDRILILGAN